MVTALFVPTLNVSKVATSVPVNATDDSSEAIIPFKTGVPEMVAIKERSYTLSLIVNPEIVMVLATILAVKVEGCVRE